MNPLTITSAWVLVAFIIAAVTVDYKYDQTQWLYLVLEMTVGISLIGLPVIMCAVIAAAGGL